LSAADRTRRERVRGATRALHGLALVAALLGAGCTDWAGYDLDSFWGRVPSLATMRTSVALDPYDMPLAPPEHSIPVGHPMGDVPPAFPQSRLDSAAATLATPFAQPSAEVIARGGELYERQCAVCHGPAGGGTGPVVGPGKYPFAPPINGASTAARSDGYIYAVITAGRGLMPPYGWALTHDDRWAVVAYVRRLQQQSDPQTGAPGARAEQP
jgi:mono/diheme cytochrome c family protein